MNVQAVHAVIHTEEQVREIIAYAQSISFALVDAEPSADAVFSKACDLLGARATTFLAPQQVPFDLSALKPNGG